MVGKKAYELLEIEVVQWSHEDVITTSGQDEPKEEAKDMFFIEDETNWRVVNG